MNMQLGLITVLAGLAALPAQADSLALAKAESSEVVVEYMADAVIEAVNQSTVSAQTAGQVMDVQFDVDDYVEQGKVLLRLKNTEQRAGLAQTQAQLKEAQARYQEAAAEHQRLSQMFEKNAVSKSAMDAASANLQAAKAKLAAAQAALSRAGEQLEYTEVKAPYSGIVVKRHVQPGEIANPGQPLMTGFALADLRAVASVPQNVAGAVRQHREARIIAQDQASIAAEKVTVLSYADPQGHNFKVRVELPQNTPNLYPGMFVKVAFVTGREKALLIPSLAVAYRGEVRAVYVVGADGAVSMRQVRLGRQLDGGLTEILAGLDAGEQIASDPVQASVRLKSSQRSGSHSAKLAGS